jgi:small subunit ribosomal protein S17
MPKKILKGVVKSIAGKQTVVVKVRKHRMDLKYKKKVIFDKKYMAHDPKEQIVVGDVVFIEESPPISKTKKWVILYDQSEIKA